MGSSGGGGASGAVSHSAYLETIHQDWLNATGVDTIEKSMTEVMDSALGSSPWTAKAAYDPDVPIAAYEAVLTAFKALLTGIVDTTNWAALFTQSATSVGAAPVLAIADEAVADIVAPADVSDITDAAIILDTTAIADQIDDEITTKVLPRFRRGMQDINAVVSSSFVIGEAVIEGFRDREVAKHASGLRVAAATKNADIGIANMNKDVQIALANLSKNTNIAKINLSKDVEVGKTNSTYATEYDRLYLEGANQILHLLLQRVAFEGDYARMSVEANRIKIVAKKEQTDQDASIDEADAKWDLEVFQYGANLLSSIGGGTSIPNMAKKNQMASALGGAMAGGAMGGMIAGAQAGGIAGNPYTVAAGAVLGLAIGLMS